MYDNSLIEKALLQYVSAGSNSLNHVIESGRYANENKEFIILQDAPASYYFAVLDNLVATFPLPKASKAPFPSNLSFFDLSMHLRVAHYLGVEHVEHYMSREMNYAVEGLITPADAEAVYRTFAAGTLPRRLVVESIAEHCLALVEYGRRPGNCVRAEVVVRGFAGIPELEAETTRYYNHIAAVRRAKRRMVCEMRAGEQPKANAKGNGRGVGGRDVPGAD